MAMCLFAMDVEAGALPGPYREHAAAAFARARLMPRELFVAWLAQPDETIADRFGVPVGEVGRRRCDLTRIPGQ
jgi:hypothetical protein